MKRILNIILLLFIFSQNAWTALTAEITPQSAKPGETLTLIITDDSANSQNLPDLTPLQNDFTIAGMQRSFSYHITNGKTSHVAQWTILLKAKKTGVLTIPALRFNQGQTNPLSVEISKPMDSEDMATTKTKANQKDIFLTTEIDNPHPWINQQIIYTMRLHNSKKLLDYRYQPPEVENALLVPLGDSRQYHRIEQGKTYMVAEQRYAIFPQKSGELTIMPPVFTLLAHDVVPTEITTQNKPMTITVKPAPVEDSQFWLPAKAIQLTETWDSTEQTLEQGNTLIRYIQIEAKGLPAQLLQSLPALDFTTQAGYSVYPEKGKPGNTLSDGDLVGKYSFKVNYLMDKSGTITIPEVKLPWFNTETNQEETAILPARTVQVQAIVDHASAMKPRASQDASPEKLAVKKPPSVMTHSSILYTIAGLFATLLAVSTGFWFGRKYAPASDKKNDKMYLNQLRQACLANDPPAALKAVLSWARVHWPNTTILNLSDIMTRVQDASLRQQLQILSSIVYGPEKKVWWQGDALWQAIRDFLRVKPDHTGKRMNLPPMNPG